MLARGRVATLGETGGRGLPPRALSRPERLAVLLEWLRLLREAPDAIEGHIGDLCQRGGFAGPSALVGEDAVGIGADWSRPCTAPADIGLLFTANEKLLRSMRFLLGRVAQASAVGVRR